MDRKVTAAKSALDTIIKKSRVHLYKPIQIAEILYRDRVFKDINPEELESYRTRSKLWRDDISIALLGRKCTSSAKYQDDLFNAAKKIRTLETQLTNQNEYIIELENKLGLTGDV